MNALILSPDKNVAETFQNRFELEGYVCMMATTVEEAAAKGRILRFDAIVVDVLANGVGVSFARDYKKRNTWTKLFSVSDSEPDPDDAFFDHVFRRPLDFEDIMRVISRPVNRPKAISIDSVKLDDRDSMLIVELVNRVVEHTNVVATTQALISENLEELVDSQSRGEEKMTYIYDMLKQVDESGILKIYKATANFAKTAASKIFWALVILIGMYLIRGPLLSFANELLHK